MDLLEIERAVIKARCDLLAARENVSAWSVLKEALSAMKVDSWESLGFRMEEVASLQSIMAVEGKVNAFIHCFAAVRKITSLHDLEIAICRNERIENFEELELGPFLRHPLVVYYFSLRADVTEVVKITTEEVVSYLGDFMLRYKKICVEIEEFLDYIAREKSAEGKEKLGIRIQSLGLHISFILEAKKSEDASLRKSLKQKIDEKSGLIPCVQSDDLSSPLEENFTGRDANNSPLTSDDEDFDHSSDEKKCDIDQGIKIQTSRMTTWALDSGSHGIKESTVSQNLSSKYWLKEDVKDRDREVLDPANYTKKGRLKENNPLLPFSDLRIFIRKWKDRCRATSLPWVIDMMIEEYTSPKPKQKRKMEKMLLQKPFIQLVNVAVVSIKSGLLDEIYDSFVRERFSEICTKSSDCESSDLALSEMRAPVIPETKKSGESTFNIGTADATRAKQVGRLGEHEVFRHFTEKLGSASVNWVNEGDESGLPYDITIRNEGKGLCYIEVKATRYKRKDRFTISAGQWKFAAEKGDSYWIVHVVLGDKAKIRIFRDPVELCSLRKLQLAIVMPKEHQVQD